MKKDAFCHVFALSFHPNHGFIFCYDLTNCPLFIVFFTVTNCCCAEPALDFTTCCVDK